MQRPTGRPRDRPDTRLRPPRPAARRRRPRRRGRRAGAAARSSSRRRRGATATPARASRPSSRPGRPRDVFERLEDAAEVNRLTGAAGAVALHFPWDAVDDLGALRRHAEELGLRIGAVNANLFQDADYKLGSVTHPDEAIRRKAIDHLLECVGSRPSSGRRRSRCGSPTARTTPARTTSRRAGGGSSSRCARSTPRCPRSRSCSSSTSSSSPRSTRPTSPTGARRCSCARSSATARGCSSTSATTRRARTSSRSSPCSPRRAASAASTSTTASTPTTTSSSARSTRSSCS